MKCLNADCGKTFKATKPWRKYCSRSCGDVVRMRVYRSLKENPAAVVSISPFFKADKLKSNSIKDKIDVYEDRVWGWLFHPVLQLLKSQHTDFAIIALVLSYFEGHWIWRTGTDSRGHSAEYFKAAFKDVFPASVPNASTQALYPGKDFAEELAQKLYTLGRCGLFHSGMAREGVFYVRRKSEQAFRWAADKDGNIVSMAIFTECFALDVAEHFSRYIKALRQTKNDELRKNFLAAWDLTHSGQPIVTPQFVGKL